MAPEAAGVAEAIRDEIRRDGPMRFDRFMELALYAPGGYYDEPPVGTAPGTDFVTSPHVHPVFAALLAEAVRGLHEAIGAPRAFELIEVGAGDGTLLRGMLPELADLAPTVTAVERSRGARAALRAVPGVVVAAELPDPGEPAIVLAHEVLDNQPFRRLVGSPTGADELYVDLDDGDLVARHLPVAVLPRPIPSAGAELLVQERAAELVVGALDGPAPRVVLAIDYGADTGSGGPAHGYAGHRVVDDLLAAPGTADITAGVDLGAIAAAVETSGRMAFGSISQHDALLALGFEAWLRTELERQQDLLRTGRGAAAVGAWSGRSRATLLIDPAGLGRFRWFVAATEGVDEPAWLAAARAGGSASAGE
jgi:SAM-dependent MidA family methyltransferase